MIKEGIKAPDFTLPGTGNKDYKLSDYKGKKVILYFYPKDNTPAWTTEANGFGKNHNKLTDINAVVLGVSKDTLASHDKFTDKLNLPFVLLSDTDAKVSKLYEVYKEKTLFGKIGLGIERTTFIIDEKGKIVKIYRKPKTNEHADEVLSLLTGEVKNNK